jgi:hypothetical protein
MNDIFKEFLNNFMVIYMDGILNYFLNLEELFKYVHIVLNKFLRKKLYAKL